MELGNLTIGALVLGQFVSDRHFSLIIFTAGITVAILCYTIGYLVNS